MFWLLHLLLLGRSLSADLGDAGLLSTEQVGQYYHQRVGIPMAEAMRNAEFAGRNNTNRITNGSRTPLGAFPFVGGLLIQLESGPTSMCTCSLLSSTRAVTAAHCVWDGQDRGRTFTAVFGSTKIFRGGTRVTTNEALRHKDYNRRTLINDIALLMLPTVTFSANVAPVRLPSGALLKRDMAGRAAQAIGFGLTKDGGRVTNDQFLNHVTLKVISNEVCGRTFYIKNSQMCTSGAGGKSICFGDSGGPLVITHEKKHVLVGVSSFISGRGCQDGLPAGFTRVTTFIPWIQSHM
ncbi:PREDICTED: collagenase-like [Papilio xuthus]|uniref:Collagenase-like n=1 Tax=Papilio xuthus TaxID=66420 RepID=A0AAJ7E5E8_PAPXU|nr:PREDICTED: collagenase-like [Papilio xuthus]